MAHAMYNFRYLDGWRSALDLLVSSYVQSRLSSLNDALWVALRRIKKDIYSAFKFLTDKRGADVKEAK